MAELPEYPPIQVTNMNAAPVVLMLREVADMLEKGEAGFVSGGIIVQYQFDDAIQISSDLVVRPMSGLREPTMFVTEFLRLTPDGPEIVRMPLSQWPEWAGKLKEFLEDKNGR